MEQSASKVVIIWIREAKAFPRATSSNITRHPEVDTAIGIRSVPGVRRSSRSSETPYLEWISKIERGTRHSLVS